MKGGAKVQIREFLTSVLERGEGVGFMLRSLDLATLQHKGRNYIFLYCSLQNKQELQMSMWK